MLSAALICPNDQLNWQLEISLPEVTELEIVRVFTTYPSPEDLIRTIRVRRVELLLLCIHDWARAEPLARSIRELIPGFPIITLGSSDAAVEVVHKLQELGIREHVTSPIRASKLAQFVAAVELRLQAHPVTPPAPADLYTFLPAKPGVGASTIALSVSCALADDLDVKTLLLDADLSAGTIQFLLKLGHGASIVDMLRDAGELDEDVWAKRVARWEKLDVLHAGDLNVEPDLDISGLARVLELAGAQYEMICADLNGQFDPLSVALLRASRRVFLVATTELAPLHLAKVKMRRLTSLGVSDRVSLLLNRKGRSAIKDSEVEQQVGIPISHSFSNDYAGVQAAILRASPVSKGSKLGDSLLDLAQSLVPHKKPKPVVAPRKFLQFFQSSREEELGVD